MDWPGSSGFSSYVVLRRPFLPFLTELLGCVLKHAWDVSPCSLSPSLQEWGFLSPGQPSTDASQLLSLPLRSVPDFPLAPICPLLLLSRQACPAHHALPATPSRILCSFHPFHGPNSTHHPFPKAPPSVRPTDTTRSDELPLLLSQSLVSLWTESCRICVLWKEKGFSKQGGSSEKRNKRSNKSDGHSEAQSGNISRLKEEWKVAWYC